MLKDFEMSVKTFNDVYARLCLPLSLFQYIYILIISAQPAVKTLHQLLKALKMCWSEFMVLTKNFLCCT